MWCVVAQGCAIFGGLNIFPSLAFWFFLSCNLWWEKRKRMYLLSCKHPWIFLFKHKRKTRKSYTLNTIGDKHEAKKKNPKLQSLSIFKLKFLFRLMWFFFVFLNKTVIFGWLKLLLCGLLLKYFISNLPFSRFALWLLILKSTQWTLFDTNK